MNSKKVFAIYPQDVSSKSTIFLEEINQYLQKKCNDWDCYKIGFTDYSHTACLNSLRSNKAVQFVVFMGHGRSDCLYGSSGKHGDEYGVSPEAQEDNPDFYNKGDFITLANIDIFNDKVVFCLSCNSNDNSPNSLGRSAINKGAKAFIGFGDIPTDHITTSGYSRETIDDFKNIFVNIIKKSLCVAINNAYTIEGLFDLIKILTNKEISKVLIEGSTSNKHEIVKILYNFKSDIKIFGSHSETVI